MKQPQSSIVVRFDPDRLAWLQGLARARSEGKRAAGVPNQRVDPKWDDYTLDYLGIRMEDAVASLLGVELDEQIYLHGDAGFDLRFRDWRISIKAAFAKHNPAFVLRDRDAFRADVGVLGIDGPGTGVTVLAWIDGWRWAERSHQEDLGHGLHWIMRADEMRPIHEFLRWAGQATMANGGRAHG